MRYSIQLCKFHFEDGLTRAGQSVLVSVGRICLLPDWLLRISSLPYRAMPGRALVSCPWAVWSGMTWWCDPLPAPGISRTPRCQRVLVCAFLWYIAYVCISISRPASARGCLSCGSMAYVELPAAELPELPEDYTDVQYLAKGGMSHVFTALSAKKRRVTLVASV